MKTVPNIALSIFGQDQHSSEHFISNDHLLFWGLTSYKYPNIGNAERYMPVLFIEKVITFGSFDQPYFINVIIETLN